MVTIKCVIIEKTGLLHDTTIKNFNECDLYKKCGYKNDKDFENLMSWDVELDKTKLLVLLFGKKVGRANSENKYDLPPPIDSELLFGNLLLLSKNENNEFIDLSKDDWNKIYENLFGGFEDLGSEDSEESEDELENIPNELKTKDGYLKDGFVVDDENDDNEDSFDILEGNILLNDTDSELSEEEYVYSDEEY